MTVKPSLAGAILLLTTFVVQANDSVFSPNNNITAPVQQGAAAPWLVEKVASVQCPFANGYSIDGDGKIKNNGSMYVRLSIKRNGSEIAGDSNVAGTVFQNYKYYYSGNSYFTYEAYAMISPTGLRVKSGWADCFVPWS